MRLNSGDETRRRHERQGDPVRVLADKLRRGLPVEIQDARAAFEVLVAAGARLAGFRKTVSGVLKELAAKHVPPIGVRQEDFLGHRHSWRLRITREAAAQTWPWVELLMDVLDLEEPTDRWPETSWPHVKAALSEGWDVFWTDGSMWAPYQIQKLDDPTVDETYTLIEDEDAWEHACTHAALGHRIGLDAFRFLRRWARQEYEAVVGRGAFKAQGDVFGIADERAKILRTDPLCLGCFLRSVETPGALCAICQTP